eukprot:TRINITY_DN2317_c0_g1_i1.p1 TRINITY_DN2317_c0_g1~~TRINITY_DN2317_c0_g1_i1.p1  ORF type:complete len:262 (-),score=77.40 TRINITY_DN2317_c0_g1_i1:877-1662(-)
MQSSARAVSATPLRATHKKEQQCVTTPLKIKENDEEPDEEEGRFIHGEYHDDIDDADDCVAGSDEEGGEDEVTRCAERCAAAAVSAMPSSVLCDPVKSFAVLKKISDILMNFHFENHGGKFQSSKNGRLDSRNMALVIDAIESLCKSAQGALISNPSVADKLGKLLFLYSISASPLNGESFFAVADMQQHPDTMGTATHVTDAGLFLNNPGLHRDIFVFSPKPKIHSFHSKMNRISNNECGMQNNNEKHKPSSWRQETTRV